MAGIISSPRETEKSAAVQAIINGSTPNREYYILVSLSVCLATLAILLGSDSILIGSMLVAPLLYPLLAMALGLSTVDRPLLQQSTVTVGQSLMLGLSTASAITLIFVFLLGAVERAEVVNYIVETFTPSYLQLAVGVAAGLAASFALTKESLANAIPGVAIAVALIPPLAATGVSIAFFDMELFINSLILILSNIVGIVIASTAVFFSLNFRSQEKVIDESLKEQEKDLELDS